MRWLSEGLYFAIIPALCSILAALIFFLGDRAWLASGWMLLAGVVLLDLAGHGLQRGPVATPFHPSRLRAQLRLELALFRRSARGGADDAERSLARAARAAGRRVRSAEVLQKIGAKMHGWGPAAAPSAEDLRALLRDLSPAGLRFPLTFGWLIPPEINLPVSIAAAVIVLILGSLPPGRPTVGALLVALAVLLAVYSAVRLAVAGSSKAHEVASQRAFRTVLVSCSPDPCPMLALAWTLYAEIGHLVLIQVSDLPDWTSFSKTMAGSYHIITHRRGVAEALAAFSLGADLIVLECGDDFEIAQQIRTTTDLPPDRYLALSRDGASPPGYSWAEPMTLRTRSWRRSARARDADPYRLHVPHGRPLWIDWVSQVRLLAGIGCLAFGGAALAVLLWGATIGRALPDALWHRRRAAVCRPALRVPRSLQQSRVLQPIRLETRATLAVAALGLIACALTLAPLGFTWGKSRGFADMLGLMGAFYALIAIHAGLVPGVLMARKWSLDWNFRFLVLRRNSRRHGYAHKRFVMATCGRYGQVISIRDDTLDETDKDYGEWRESSLGFWFQIFSEIESTLRPRSFIHTWQRQILVELEVTDFAVFDWVGEITENMRWELRSAAERLPAHRILIAHSPENQGEVDDALARCRDVLQGAPHLLCERRGPDDEYIWANHDAFDRAFTARLHAALSELVEEPRGAFPRTISGAWAYPRRCDKSPAPAERHPEADGVDVPVRA